MYLSELAKKGEEWALFKPKSKSISISDKAFNLASLYSLSASFESFFDFLLPALFSKSKDVL
jgi:hypothetical protein